VLLTGNLRALERIVAEGRDEPLAKLSDFGLSRSVERFMTQCTGNAFYLGELAGEARAWLLWSHRRVGVARSLWSSLVCRVAAPEVFRGQHYTEKADTDSYGETSPLQASPVTSSPTHPLITHSHPAPHPPPSTPQAS
jgi:serine/threonine protein kinase